MEISAQQLAELLLGIARAQAGIVQGLENEMAGVRSGRIIPALQNVAHLRDHPQPTLTDLPVRVLLGTLGRQVPDAAAIVRDLERLLKTSISASPPRYVFFRIVGPVAGRYLAPIHQRLDHSLGEATEEDAK
jgi:hypothetical protein